MAEPTTEFAGIAAELRQLARAEPFVPFEIARRSGARYVVTTSDYVAMNGNTVVVIVPGTGIVHFGLSDLASVRTRAATSN